MSITLSTVTKALPAAAGDVTTDGIATGEDGGELCYPHELVLTCPALTVGMLPNDCTASYKIEQDDDAEFGTVETLYPQIALQTGAGGAGAAAQSVRFKLPSTVKKYVRVKVTAADYGNSTFGNATTKSVVLKLTQ